MPGPEFQSPAYNEMFGGDQLRSQAQDEFDETKKRRMREAQLSQAVPMTAAMDLGMLPMGGA